MSRFIKTAALALFACGVAANTVLAGDPSQTKSAGELKLLVDQSSKSLPNLIQAAESKTSGKSSSACVVEWRNVSQSVLSDPNGDMSRSDIEKFEPSHPVAHVVCVNNNNQVIEAIVCSRTGKVIATRQGSQFTPGKGPFASTTTTTITYNDGNIWNRAPSGRWQKTSDLKKKAVHDNKTNERIGSIEDIVIDPDSGRIMYQIVEFSDKMGHGNRWFAIPLSVAKLSPDYKSVNMDYSTSLMNNANGFDKSNWPNMADEKWNREVYKSYDKKPYWTSAGAVQVGQTGANSRRLDREGTLPPQRWQKASDLIGKTVRNPQTNEDLGSLKDIVVDADSGRILYGVLSFGGVLGIGDKLFALPWGALDLAPDYKTIALTVEKDRLKKAEGFDQSHWPNMADERWAGTIYDYYGQPRYWENK
jgi:sporulation protein YlmC with PRC-barrel domain